MRKLIVFVILVLVFVFIFLLKGENVFFTVLRPIQKSFYQTGRQPLTDDDFCRQLKIENVKLKTIQIENETLKQHLNFLEKSKDKAVLANVIGQKSEAGFNWLLVDQGIDQGIEIGLAVIDQQGVLVGTIVKTKKSISYCQPIFDARSSLAADIITYESLSASSPGNNPDQPKTVSGVVQGEYGLILKMKYIPLDKQINIGDAVITTGLENNIRWGIVIGQVIEIDKKPNAIFQEVIVKPLLNPNPKIVSIILPQ